MVVDLFSVVFWLPSLKYHTYACGASACVFGCSLTFIFVASIRHINPRVSMQGRGGRVKSFAVVYHHRFQKLRKKAGVTPLDIVEFYYGEFQAKSRGI